MTGNTVTEEQTIFGYFDNKNQMTPAYDPGFDVPCPFCLSPVGRLGIRTISLMRVAGAKSYFYRAHIPCHNAASKDDVEVIESSVIDADEEEP